MALDMLTVYRYELIYIYIVTFSFFCANRCDTSGIIHYLEMVNKIFKHQSTVISS